MIKISCDAEHNALVLELAGNIDAAEARRSFADLDKVLTENKKGFTLLADFSSIDTMEPEVEGEILKAMDLFNERGVAEVLRVLPDPDLEIGFNMLSVFHYSRRVQIRTVRTRAEAEALLRERVKG